MSIIARTGDTIASALEDMAGRSGEELLSDRRAKFLKIGRQIG